MDTKKKSHLLELLPDGSLYDFVPDLITVTLEHGEFKIAHKGDIIAQEGSDIEYLVIPIDENIKLYTIENQKKNEIGFLQRKRSLALKEILFNEKYKYNAICEHTTRFVQIPKSAFLKKLEANPLVNNYLKLIVQSSGLRSFKNFLLSRGLQKEQVIEIFSRINLYDYELKKGEVLNHNSGNLYFIKNGSLDVHFLKTSIAFKKLKIHEGAFVGGEALLPPYFCNYNLMAIEDTKYHYANIKDILPVLKKYDVVSCIHDEPWIHKRAKLKRVKPWAGGLSESIGTPISSKDLKKLKGIINKTSFDIAFSDNHSFYLNLINYCDLLNIEINQVAVESKMSQKKNIDISHVAFALNEYPVEVDFFKLTIKDILKLKDPYLFCFNGRLLLFLKKAKGKNSFYALDTAIGIVLINIKDIDREELECVRVRKNTFFKDSSYFSMITSSLVSRKITLIFIMLLIILNFLTSLLPPFFMQEILDEALLIKDIGTIKTLTFGLFFVVFFNLFLDFIMQLLFRDVSIEYDRKLTNSFYKSILGKPFEYFQQNNTGELLSRFYELDFIRSTLSVDSILAITDILKVLVYTLILFSYDYRLALIPVSYLVFVSGGLYVYLKSLKNLNIDEFSLLSKGNSILNEILNSLESIRLSKASKKLKDKWEQSVVDFLRNKRKKQNDNAYFNWFVDLLSGCVRIVVLLAAVYSVIDNRISVGAVLAISIYVGGMMEPINNITQFIIKLQRNLISVNKVGEIVQDQFLKNKNIGDHYANLYGKIKLERVFFKYEESNNWIIDDLELSIFKGQKIAIIGPSGSGKTTLAKIIAGIIVPNSGRVFYDDYDSALLTKSCIYHSISYISQDTNIFSGDSVSNIALSDINVDKELYEASIELAGAQDVIEVMDTYRDNPTQLKTESLSLGQRQKVSIARAFYNQPQVLIMDEITSGLDRSSERKILKAIASELKTKTQIFVTYKENIVKNVDLVIVMDKGKIVAQGTHDELKENKFFYQLFM